MSLVPFLIAAAVIAGGLLVILGVAWQVQPTSEKLRERLKRYEWKNLSKEEQQKLRRSPMSDVLAGVLQKTVATQNLGDKLATQMARANLKLTVPEYLLITLLLLFFVTLAASLISGSVPIGLLFGVPSMYLPWWYVKRRESQRINAFDAQLPESLRVIASSLKAGYGIIQAMELVSRDTSPPLGEEFGRVVHEVGLGLSQERALENLARRIPSGDLRLMVTAIRVQHEVGGNLVALLESIAETMRERIKLKRQIQVLTAQQRAAGYIISGLPIALGGVLLLLAPSYMMELFTPGWYILMPIAGALGILSGFLVMRRIIDIDV